MKKLSVAKIIGLILAVVQLIVSGIVSIQFLNMGFLPTKYWALITGVLMLLFLIAFVLQFVNKIHWIGKIISVLMTAVLIFGLFYINQANQALKDISQRTVVEKNQILVVVKNDSPAKTIDDLKDSSWGVQYADDVELMGKAVDAVKEKLGTSLTLTAFDNYGALYPALMSGEIDAMILNSSYLDLIDELTAEEDGWYFWDEEKQKWIYSKGVKATMPLHEAEKEIILKALKVAREVFR